MKSTFIKVTVFLLIQNFLFSCIPLPGSRFYKPVSEWEESVFKVASRSIFPDDVRKDLNLYSDSLLVWPGIIQEYEVINHEDKIELEFLLEHHYYDWIEDFSIQQAKIFLSPRGEGLFKTSWNLKKDTNLEEIEKYSKPENLALVYGKPREILSDSIVVIECKYFRGIEKQWYRTDVMDYGRPGSKKESMTFPMY